MSDLITTLHKKSDASVNVYPNIKSDNIPSNAVDSTKIQDGSVTTAKINDGAVTTAKINDGAVTQSKLAVNSVATTRIQDNAVTTAKINDGAITNVKIQNGTISDNKLETPKSLYIGHGLITFHHDIHDYELYYTNLLSPNNNLDLQDIDDLYDAMYMIGGYFTFTLVEDNTTYASCLLRCLNDVFEIKSSLFVDNIAKNDITIMSGDYNQLF